MHMRAVSEISIDQSTWCSACTSHPWLRSGAFLRGDDGDRSGGSSRVQKMASEKVGWMSGGMGSYWPPMPTICLLDAN